MVLWATHGLQAEGCACLDCKTSSMAMSILFEFLIQLFLNTTLTVTVPTDYLQKNKTLVINYFSLYTITVKKFHSHI